MQIPEMRFDLAKLNPESPEFYLMINPSEIFEQAVSVEFCLIACPVQSAFCIQNIVRDELFFCEPVIVEIAKRNAFTAKQ